MTQNSDKDPKENRVFEVKPIKLPDEIWQEIEERDRRVQQKQNEDQTRELTKKTPPEREEIEKETRHAPEKRTEEESMLEDERIMELLDNMRREGQY